MGDADQTSRPYNTEKKEVWGRRDGVEGRGGVGQECTARGRAHWLGVMKDWGWEGKIK